MGLDTFVFVLSAEQAFEIDIPDVDAASIFTVGEFTSYVHGRLLDIQGNNALNEAAIYQQVTDFLISNFKVEPARISRESHFIKDLRLDH